MLHNPSEALQHPDNVDTLPAKERVAETAMPISDSWDSEAPTAVHTRRPLFARPPPLPQTRS
jgi:hypothetical protein